jgi:uncharacterized lipoprotein YajG
MISLRTTNNSKLIRFFILLTYVLLATAAARAQSTTATGNIQGTLSDPSGAVVEGAKVTITNKDTGQSIAVTTSSAGAYNSGTLVPGN